MFNSIPAFSSVFLAAILWTDLKHRRIPNVVTLPTWVAGITLNLACSGPMGIIDAITGSGIGFLLMLLPFLMSGMGAGDVKAIAALGALIGPSAIFQTFLYTALAGGVIALVYCAVKCNILGKARGALIALGAFAGSRDIRCLGSGATNPSRHKFPYAPAIALGYLAYLLRGNLV